jgi:hypothetical protein
MWKEAAEASLKILSRHLPGRAKENKKIGGRDSRSVG